MITGRFLTSRQYDILYRKQTEPAFSGKYCRFNEVGTYYCAACGKPLFSSRHKFDCGHGWPSFKSSIPGSIRFLPNYRGKTPQTEILCANCHSHLGHIFGDNPQLCETQYSINSLALDFRQETF